MSSGKRAEGGHGRAYDGAVTESAGPARYRCSSCGNLTRFDVTTTRTTRAFHHYSVGGELSVEDEERVAERVEEVTCRWCGPAGRVHVVTEADIDAAVRAADPTT